MKSTNWKEIAELAGITAIVASLIFVGPEMRQAREIAMSDGALANAANEIERYNAISENADIWIRGNSGDELTENDKVVFRNLIQTVLAAELMEIARLRRVGADDIADTLTADFAAFLFENPGARRTWSEGVQRETKYRSLLVPGKKMYIGNEFADAVNQHLARLDQLQN